MTGGDAVTIRIGTRGSALARWQAEHVAERLRSLKGAPTVELEIIQTEGDRIQDVALSRLPGKAFFTKELEQAVLDGLVDLAVHSMKDVETTLPEGLEIGGVLKREDPRDVLVARDDLRLESLPEGAVIGTSSLRRAAFLRRWRPDLRVKDLRGNVPTRIEKLDAGDYDAIVLAAAGIHRLGLQDRVTDYFPSEILLPAVAQGAIGVQLRSGDERIGEYVRSLEHPATRAAITAERALLRAVEGGCQIPVGAYATVEGDMLRLEAAISSLDGRDAVTGETEATVAHPNTVGETLARDLLGRGGAAILADIRSAMDAV